MNPDARNVAEPWVWPISTVAVPCDDARICWATVLEVAINNENNEVMGRVIIAKRSWKFTMPQNNSNLRKTHGFYPALLQHAEVLEINYPTGAFSCFSSCQSCAMSTDAPWYWAVMLRRKSISKQGLSSHKPGCFFSTALCEDEGCQSMVRFPQPPQLAIRRQK
jgi:hypothetical protein